jgi:hypothetical protein
MPRRPLPEPIFREFRWDGWPLCPRCGEDELYSVVLKGWRNGQPVPPRAQCFAGAFECYACGSFFEGVA